MTKGPASEVGQAPNSASVKVISAVWSSSFAALAAPCRQPGLTSDQTRRPPPRSIDLTDGLGPATADRGGAAESEDGGVVRA